MFDVAVYDIESFATLVRRMSALNTVVLANTESVTAIDEESGDRVELILENTEVFEWLRVLHVAPHQQTLTEVMHYVCESLIDGGQDATDNEIARHIATVFSPNAEVPEVMSVGVRAWSIKVAPFVCVTCQFVVDFIEQRIMIRPLADAFQRAEDDSVEWLLATLRSKLPNFTVVNGAV
jgi:hypothetical protein